MGHGIVELIAYSDFQMQVGTRGPACAAHQPYYVPCSYFLAVLDKYPTQMRIMGVDVSAVGKEHRLTVAPVAFSGAAERHSSVRAGSNRLAFACCYIDPAVKYAVSIPER